MTDVRDAIAAILDTMTLEQFVAAPGAASLVDDEIEAREAAGLAPLERARAGQ